MTMIDDAKMVMPFLRAASEGREILYARKQANHTQWLPLSGVEDIVAAIVNGFTVRVGPPKTFEPLGRSELRQLISEHLVRRVDGSMFACVGVRINEHGQWLATLRQVGMVNLGEYTAEDLLQDFALADGTPCGVLAKTA
jgi:hypothetical protein